MRRGLHLALLLLAAVAARPAAAESFAFVLLGEASDGRPLPIARAVIEDGRDCPVLRRASGAAEPMRPRQAPGPSFASVLVCEAAYPWDEAARVEGPGLRHDLPRVSSAPLRRVLVVGDSGCAGRNEPRAQSCAGGGYGSAWPFGTIARDGRRDDPELIVHVGDYNYRGTPRSVVLPPAATGFSGPLKVEVFDTGDLDDADETPSIPIGPGYFSQNVPGSPRPDNWIDWRDDFFRPAARLLAAAPWVFLRGNHELCSRGGPGWFYLLDSASPLLGGDRRQDRCPPQLPPTWRVGAWPPFARPFEGLPFPTEPTRPFRLRLGGIDLVVLDSSDAGDAEIYAPQHYEEIFRRVAAMLAETTTPTWLVTHRPIWGVVRAGKGIAVPGAPYGFINLTQQRAVATAFPRGLPDHVAAIVSGHMHRFQAIGFDGRRPPQLVVGNGGMELSRTFPAPPPDQPRQPVRVPGLDGMTGWVTGLSDFGALDVTLQPGGAWTGRLVGPSGATLATCDSRRAAAGTTAPPCTLE